MGFSDAGIPEDILTVYGDIIYRNAALAARLAPDAGAGYNFLKSFGPGAAPAWTDIAEIIMQVTGLYRRSFGLIIPHPAIALAVNEDHSGGAFTSTPSLAITVPSVAKGTALSSPNAMDGGIAHQNSPAMDTDQTAATNNATANDMSLLPASGYSVGDGFYFGYASLWDWLAVNIGTAGAGTYTITWQYWNGTGWTALSLKYNETANWKTTSLKRVHFVRPGDWASLAILGVTAYWIKAAMTAYTSVTTQPKGTQSWCGYY